ncbi:MAG: RtcB family protein [Lachnospiraceae bacterium]|nr:RtcB family protein [Lachnospiraceae bacterium]
MKEIIGNYAKAIIFTDDVEEYAQAQIKMICDNPVSQGSKIRVMPDVHPGQVGTIGLTMTVGERILPNLLGIDIGCGVTCALVKGKQMELQKLDSVIRKNIPSGFRVRESVHHMAEEFPLERLRCPGDVNWEKAFLSLGTLGGGNHFIEVDKSGEGRFYLVIHTGSRNLGKEVTERYLRAGAKILKERGMEVPYPMTWLEGELMEDYIADVKMIQEYALLNRRIILWQILKEMKLKCEEEFSSVHNYLEESGGVRILRKGAISAKEGEQVIIPVNMRDGVVLGKGKGNLEWNQSAPHGSGRRIQRSEVKQHYTVSAFKNEMKGIYCSCIGADTLDEAPFAYRNMQKLLGDIKDAVEVTDIIRPVYNFKAGGKS